MLRSTSKVDTQKPKGKVCVCECGLHARKCFKLNKNYQKKKN